ncbi:MAG: hypothetical protein COA57_11355 [Flavobacteriales bacterium]|nr:MAG: hypothetical protein COA57_11355 [Flavobacteriales bacterium]
MSKIYHFRVLIDYNDADVFRDIEISDGNTFEEFHIAIQKAFKFDNKQMASFFMSNDAWDKGQEITLMAMDFDDGSTSVYMSETKINDMVSKAGQKLVYVFDFMVMWCFFIELVKISKPEKSKKYPCVVKEYGDAPEQYSKKVKIKPEDDKYLLKNIDVSADSPSDDIFEGFDDFEQYH